jgi:hypothetical protein
MGHLAKAARYVKHELLEILPVTLFFLIGLNLIAYSKHLVLAEQGIAYEGIATATFGALVIAKIVLVVDKLSVTRWFRSRPIYQTILYRAVFYSVCVLVFRLVEMLVGHWIHEGDLGNGVDAARASFVWHHMTFLQLWTFILFLVYLTVEELLDEFGGDRRLKVFLSRRERSKRASTDETS